MSRFTLLIVSSVLALAATPAYAQQAAPAEEEASGITDIVVTAQRRNESVQDVPIAISAFSSEQMEAQGISNTLQLGQYVPNLFALSNTGLGSANGYYLRGLGNSESIATFDPPVGTYVDNIYLSRQNANNLSFLDVERVEVLRGPQGTLFGRNTTGGAVSVIMRDPGKDFGGYVESGFGRYNRKLLRASVDLPLGDNAGIKVSGFWQNDDGYVKNVTTGQTINDDDGWGARLGVKVKVGENVTWKGSVAHLVSDGENVVNFLCNPNAPTECNGRYATTGLLVGSRNQPTSLFAGVTVTGRKANYGMGNWTQNTIATSNFAIDIGDNTSLELITGGVWLRQQFAIDFFDGRGGPAIATPFPAVRGFARGGFVIANEGAHNQFTQEAKLSGKLGDGKFEYVGGLYYIKETNTTDFADIFSVFTGAPGGLGLLLADRTLRNTTEAFAGYVQGDFNLTDQIKLTAGIRYTDEKKEVKFTDNRASCNDGSLEVSCIDNANFFVLPPTVAASVAIPTKQQAKLWTPRFAINFKPNNDLLIFASATRGFKSGGWNARATSASQLLPFAPEKVWSYEAGIKSDLMGRKLRANLTFFYLDTKNLQTPSAFLNPATGAPTFITRNFADYRNKGIEAEFVFAPVDGLNLYANIGYQDDKYVINRSAPTTDEYGIQSVAALQAICQAAIAAGKVPGGPNVPATAPSIATCGAGIIAPNGSIAEPVRTPDFTLAIGGSYKMPLGGGGWSVTPSINASYASDSETGTSNVTVRSGNATGTNGTFTANLLTGDFIAGSFSKAHWVVNAGLTFKGMDDNMSLGIECSNCFNTSYVQSSLSNYSYYNRPMEWMIRSKYKF